MSIRPATKNDLEHIVRINNEIQPHPWTRSACESELASSLKDPESFIATVALDREGQVAGYQFTRVSCEGGELLMIGVGLAHQRQGVARALMADLVTRLKGYDELFLEVSAQNQAAKAFYEGLGFKTYLIRRAYYRDGQDALCMKLELAKP